MSARNSLNLRR